MLQILIREFKPRAFWVWGGASMMLTFSKETLQQAAGNRSTGNGTAEG